MYTLRHIIDNKGDLWSSPTGNYRDGRYVCGVYLDLDFYKYGALYIFDSYFLKELVIDNGIKVGDDYV